MRGVGDPVGSCMTETPPNHATPPGLRGGVFVLAMALAAAALLLSGYLTYASLAADGPVGCGAGSGCGEVLGSKWAKVFGVPVGLPAVAAYVALLVAMPMTRRGPASVRRSAWLICGGAGGAILGAAGWFVYLQFVELRALCPYCLADHAIGVVLSVLLISAAVRRRAGAISIGLSVGLLLAIAMALVQINSEAVVHRLPVPSLGDYDLQDDAGRRVGLLGGQLKLDLADEIVLGDPNAEQVVAVMFDHACPHCKRVHRLLDEVRAARDGEIAVVLMPMPLHIECNRLMKRELGPRFAESCARTRLFLAIALTDRAKAETFDAWFFAAEGYRSAEEARARAVELIGADVLDRALADPRIDAIIARNVDAFEAAGVDRVPVVLAPWTDLIWGTIEEREAVEALIDEARANARKAGDAEPAGP